MIARLASAALLALSLCSCATNSAVPDGGARATKQFGLFACATPTGFALGPCWNFWTEFDPDTCQVVIIGATETEDFVARCQEEEPHD